MEIKITNRLVQEDLYKFLSKGNNCNAYISTKHKFQLCRVEDDGSIIFYPYTNNTDLFDDYSTIKRLIRRLN